MMQTTMAAINLIKGFEGFRSEWYLDAVGVPTIGYGTTRYADGSRPKPGDTLSEVEATEELFVHVREAVEPDLDRIFGHIALQPSQRDALASFIYNLGGDESGYPSLIRIVEKYVAGKATEADVGKVWMLYHNAGGKALLGLYRRRFAEFLMFLGLPWESAMSVPWNTDIMAEVKRLRPQPVESKPAPKPAPEPVKEAPKVEAPQIKTKPPSVFTKRPEEVPYHITPDAGLKPLEESERAHGYVWQTVGVTVLRFAALSGVAGAGAIASDPVLSNALVTLFVVGGVGATGLVARAYGDWKRKRGEEMASQGLF